MPPRILISLIIVLAFFSCKKENRLDCFKSNGKKTSEIRIMDEFDEVEVADKMEVEIVYGKEHQVVINAGKNLLNNISTSISNGVLKIDNKNTCNFVRGYKNVISITVSTPYVSRVINKGVGPITIEGLNQDSIFVRAENSGDIYLNGNFKEIKTSSHGNGDIYLNGTTNSLLIYSFGTNYTRGEQMLIENYAFIETYSIGDAHLKLSNTAALDYKIYGKGNVYYTGDPVSTNGLNPADGGGRLIKE